ncbi:MAG: alpha/beta hydrolase [Proteobacteria bacterium]|nr:alpha/beta hydrolase [Pseudomonadota bacterium]
MADYSIIDNSPTLWYVFYPRNERTLCPANAFDVSVPVDDSVFVSCRFYVGDSAWPWILFFHGNGEMVSDYDRISPFYIKNGLNLIVADYRGYGASNGTPSLTDLFKDARVIFRTVGEELKNRGFNTEIWVMGRSLGSLSAIEIAYNYRDQIKGLIIESGFANILKILMHLGLPLYGIDVEGIDEECLSIVGKISLPTLIIHGEEDVLVSPREAEIIYRHIGSDKKRLVLISGADHNDIMFVGMNEYFEALRQFIFSV